MAIDRRPRRVAATLVTEGVAVYEVWPYVLAIFLSGSVMTALGLTILASNGLVLAGMVLTSLGIASMWLPGRGAIRWRSLVVIVAFLVGNFCTAMALTLSASNQLLLVGMILSAIGIGGMWAYDKHGPLARAIFAAFVGGTSLQAIGLTEFPSNALIGVGMMLVSGGVFGMWLHAHPFRVVRDYERDEVISREIDQERQTLETHRT